MWPKSHQIFVNLDTPKTGAKLEVVLLRQLCSKQYNKIYMIVGPQLSGGWQYNYSTKTRQAGRANEQSMTMAEHLSLT